MYACIHTKATCAQMTSACVLFGMYTFKNAYVCVCMYVRMFACAKHDLWVYVRMGECARVCTHTRLHNTFTGAISHAHTFIGVTCMYVCVHICLTCMYVCIYNTFTGAISHVHTFIHTYICRKRALRSKKLLFETKLRN
jgi:hypothetical protein